MKTFYHPNGSSIYVSDNSEVSYNHQPEVNTKITQLGFLSRFLDDEAIDIDLASIGATREAALIRRYLQKVNAASHIDLSRQDLMDDLNKLVQFGLLSSERVESILTTPIAPHEQFRG